MDGLNMHYTTTLNMIFSVTYYLESRNAISMYYIYIFYFINKCQINSQDIIEKLHLYLAKNYIDKKQI